MLKKAKKNNVLKAYATDKEKRAVEELFQLSGKESMSEFILETILNVSPFKPKNDGIDDILVLHKKHFSDVRSFQAQQQITRYIVMQFVMWLNVENHSREEIMEFYDEQFKKASEKFGNDE